MNFPPEVEERLRSEPIMWMTTVTPDGRPQPSPIWFLWSGAEPCPGVPFHDGTCDAELLFVAVVFCW